MKMANEIITPRYAALNSTLHKKRREYGAYGRRYAEHVYGLLALYRPQSVIDFGCGKGSLAVEVEKLIADRQPSRFRKNREFAARRTDLHMPDWQDFDPAIEGKDTLPELPADLLVTTDVLEHVEPELLDNCLDTIIGLTGRFLFAAVALKFSNKTLADGRNTHQIVESENFWIDRFKPIFNITLLPRVEVDTVAFVGIRKC
jgi:hypothetical protein